jgi:hypothetical protein
LTRSIDTDVRHALNFCSASRRAACCGCDSADRRAEHLARRQLLERGREDADRHELRVERANRSVLVVCGDGLLIGDTSRDVFRGHDAVYERPAALLI